MSSIVRQFLLSRSYFLKIAAIYFLDSFLKGFVSIAFINSMKLMPPVSQVSNSATISQVVFRLGSKPFWVSRSLRSLGKSTPIPVESQASKTSLRSITSWQVRLPVTQRPASNSLRSFLWKRTPQISALLILDWLLSGLQPNFWVELRLLSLLLCWKEPVLPLLYSLIDIVVGMIQYCGYNSCNNFFNRNLKLRWGTYKKEDTYSYQGRTYKFIE